MGFITCIMYCCTQVLTPSIDWTKQDQQALEAAQKHCREYYGQSPCLIKFKKIEDSIYSAICGKNNNE